VVKNRRVSLAQSLYKLIEYSDGSQDLFDLDNDPRESQDLFDLDNDPREQSDLLEGCTDTVSILSDLETQAANIRQ